MNATKQFRKAPSGRIPMSVIGISAFTRHHGAIQPCCWNRFLSTSAISWEICLALPSTVLLPLFSPYTFIPVLTMRPAGLWVANRGHPATIPLLRGPLLDHGPLIDKTTNRRRIGRSAHDPGSCALSYAATMRTF